MFVASWETKPESLMMFPNVDPRKGWFVKQAGPHLTTDRVALA